MFELLKHTTFNHWPFDYEYPTDRELDIYIPDLESRTFGIFSPLGESYNPGDVRSKYKELSVILGFNPISLVDEFELLLTTLASEKNRVKIIQSMLTPSTSDPHVEIVNKKKGDKWMFNVEYPNSSANNSGEQNRINSSHLNTSFVVGGLGIIMSNVPITSFKDAKTYIFPYSEIAVAQFEYLNGLSVYNAKGEYYDKDKKAKPVDITIVDVSHVFGKPRNTIFGVMNPDKAMLVRRMNDNQQALWDTRTMINSI